ncbi:MAG: hypothetical protein ABGX16_11560 [Pirellulales bacterium]
MAKKSKSSELSPERKVEYTDCTNRRDKSLQRIMDLASDELTAAGFDPPGRDLWAWKKLGISVEIHTTVPDPRQIADELLAWSMKEKHKEMIRVQTQLASQTSVNAIDELEIEWTRPMSKKEAAKHLNCPVSKKAQWISNCVKDGELKIRQLTRQSFQFNLDFFPLEIRDKLRTTSAK